MLMPGPTSITDFAVLTDSKKSTLKGDTVEIPSITAYFSNNYRDFVVPFYSEDYKNLTKFPFKPLKLNHPPEFAFTAIKIQTQSTYLEELTYPFRNSLFVNGLEPFDKEGNRRYSAATFFEQDEELFETKVTLRFHYSPLWVRIVVWLGINISAFLIWKMTRRIIFNA